MGKGRDKRRHKHEEVVRPAKIEPPKREPEAPPAQFASVPAPLKPKPSPLSGAIALPEPDAPEDLTPDFIGIEVASAM
jgi:hypothetical protein